MAFTMILCAGTAQYWGNIQLKKINDKSIFSSPPEGLENGEYENKLYGIMKKVIPQSLYFSISSQLTVFLVSLFGSVKSVAEIGALSRISIAFTMLSSIFGLIVIPRFAKIPAGSSLLFIRYFQIGCTLLVFASGVPILLYTFPQFVIWVIGDNYNISNSEVVVLGGTIGIGLLNNSLFSLNNCRAFILKPIIFIPINIAVTTLAIILVIPNSTYNALLFELYRGLAGPALFIGVFLYFHKTK
jgi:hypothetical protein